MDSLFFVSKDGSEFSYSRLLADISSCTRIPKYCRLSDTYDIFSTLVSSLVHGIDIVLLDADFSETELRALEIEPEQLDERITVDPKHIAGISDLLEAIACAATWRLTLFTSGTTGLPKKVTHNLKNLSRLVRFSPKHAKDVWAFAYNPTHIAGVQVFFQAILNSNTLVEVFGLPRDLVLKRIERYQITNISATPTFYRMLLPINDEYPTVKRITSGGERFDSNLTKDLARAFPNAKLRNIYASTEAGSVLESINDRFKITDPENCRIEDHRLFIHNSLLGNDDNTDGWYDTGDLVEIVDEASGEFVFVNRASEMINVGGYKANPLEIEEALCSHPAITKAKVWGRPNPVVGNILMADLVIDGFVSEREIREFLKDKLQGFKIPRIISFVTDIETTRSGKIRRA